MKKNREEKSMQEIIRDEIISLYLIVILGFFPLFYKYQYSKMGTSKYNIFLYSSVAFLGLFCLVALIAFLLQFKKNGMEKLKQMINSIFLQKNLFQMYSEKKLRLLKNSSVLILKVSNTNHSLTSHSQNRNATTLLLTAMLQQQMVQVSCIVHLHSVKMTQELVEIMTFHSLSLLTQKVNALKVQVSLKACLLKMQTLL